MDICGLTPMAKAAAEPGACILPPQTLEKLADAKAEEDAKLKAAFDSGSIGDLGGLTVKQLQTLAKQNGIAIARTKADFIKLLDAAGRASLHDDLGGEAPEAKLAHAQDRGAFAARKTSRCWRRNRRPSSRPAGRNRSPSCRRSAGCTDPRSKTFRDAKSKASP
jgi:hypothetical protein